jgi:hypothetical protein
MPRYLIEIPHSDEHDACVRALDAIERHGSHFVTRAEFSCADGRHAGWMIADLESRKEALQFVPPQFRPEVRIVELKAYTREEIAAMLAELEPGS